MITGLLALIEFLTQAMPIFTKLFEMWQVTPEQERQDFIAKTHQAIQDAHKTGNTHGIEDVISQL